MALSRFAYVRSYEQHDAALPNTYLLVRLDGKGFHKFSAKHKFEKPNDARALELMNHAARAVMQQLRPEVVLAFGESDEYSFLLKRSCALYSRRQSKILTYITSLFTSNYVLAWRSFFPDQQLQDAPSFDGRIVIYPSDKEVRDYFSWRQADTHVNNLYNTVFWAMVHGGKTEREAHEKLKGTISSDKNEILFNDYQINYDSLPALFRKGSTLVWQVEEDADERRQSASQTSTGQGKRRSKSRSLLRTLHVDIISDAFWSSDHARTMPSRGPVITHGHVDTANGMQDLSAPSESEAPTLQEQAAQPIWTDPRRTESYAGLGALALAG